MNIAIVNEAYWKNTGIPTHIRSYVEEFLNHDVQVKIFATDVDAADTTGSVEYINVRRSHRIFVKMLRFYRKLCQYSCANSIDVLHVHDSIAFIPAYVFSRRKKIPVVFTCHGTVYQKSCAIDYSLKYRVLYRISDKLFSILSDRLIAISSEIKDVLVLTGAKKGKVSLVPGILSRRFFRAGITPRVFPEEKVTCLFVGAIRPTKGCEYLVRAVPKVLDQRSDIEFVLAGPCDDKEEYVKILDLISHHNLQEKVKLAGFVPRENLVDLYASADIFVLPSLNEPQGLVVLEAMSHALPIVASNVGGIKDMVIDGENGLLVEPANSDELAAAIIRLCTDETLYADVSAAASRYVSTRLIDDNVAKILAIYGSLRGRRNKGDD
jgi:glycosyltransferase involved in cell wall biosynthesis